MKTIVCVWYKTWLKEKITETYRRCICWKEKIMYLCNNSKLSFPWKTGCITIFKKEMMPSTVPERLSNNRAAKRKVNIQDIKIALIWHIEIAKGKIETESKKKNSTFNVWKLRPSLNISIKRFKNRFLHSQSASRKQINKKLNSYESINCEIKICQ